MLFLQIGNIWINAQRITMIQQDDTGEVLNINFGEKEDDEFLALYDPAEIDAFLHWLAEKAPTYVVI